MNVIFLRFMEVWTQWVPCKVNVKGVTYFAYFARDPLREPQKNKKYFLFENIHHRWPGARQWRHLRIHISFKKPNLTYLPELFFFKLNKPITGLHSLFLCLFWIFRSNKLNFNATDVPFQEETWPSPSQLTFTCMTVDNVKSFTQDQPSSLASRESEKKSLNIDSRL